MIIFFYQIIFLLHISLIFIENNIFAINLLIFDIRYIETKIINLISILISCNNFMVSLGLILGFLEKQYLNDTERMRVIINIKKMRIRKKENSIDQSIFLSIIKKYSSLIKSFFFKIKTIINNHLANLCKKYPCILLDIILFSNFSMEVL